MAKFIYCTANNVVRRVTVDAVPQIGPDEAWSDVPGRNGLGVSSTGYWKIAVPANTFTEATPAEIQAAADSLRVSLRPPQVVNLLTKCDQVIAAGAVPAAVKDFVTALKALF